MQKKKIVFAGIVLCLVLLAAFCFYLYQKPRNNVLSITPAYTLSASGLYKAFEQNEQKANKQFVGKVIEVRGTVENMQSSDSTVNVILSAGTMGGINCSLVQDKKNKQVLPLKGAVIRIKARCSGYLMDVNMVDAVIVH